MKIADGLNLPGWCVEIPDCSRNELPEFMYEQGCRVGVEIGVERGYFGEKLAQAGLRVFGIDPWLDYEDYVERNSAKKMERFYREAQARLAPYDYEIMRMTSMEAVCLFADRELDFVYIDGNHSLVYVVNDLYWWSKKVKPGGIIAGDDYIVLKDTKSPFHCNVVHAVKAYVKSAKIPKWYVLGRKAKVPGEKRDKCRNFMWFNP